MMKESTLPSKEQTFESEMWDIYDENRNLTGKLHRRGEPMKSGEYHLVVHVCIFNSKNELLIQRRQPFKSGWPNMWDVTVGGSAIAGDNSQGAAMRETKEELGLTIDLSKVRPHFTINFENGFDDFYLITQEVEINTLTLQPEEVREVKWVNKEELLQMMEKGEMVPHKLLDKLFELRNYYGLNYDPNHIEIKYATIENLASWMNFIDVIRWNENDKSLNYFPGLETDALVEGYRKTVIKNMNRGSAICALVGKQVVGILLFSVNRNMLCCLAVHPEYRRKQIASKMVNEMIRKLDRSKDIIVETFLKEDIRGESVRSFYEGLGFVAGDLILWEAEDGSVYPLQRYILKRKGDLCSQKDTPCL